VRLSGNRRGVLLMDALVGLGLLGVLLGGLNALHQLQARSVKKAILRLQAAEAAHALATMARLDPAAARDARTVEQWGRSLEVDHLLAKPQFAVELKPHSAGLQTVTGRVTCKVGRFDLREEVVNVAPAR
jgi:Tfp pilus assembly protein PilN